MLFPAGGAHDSHHHSFRKSLIGFAMRFVRRHLILLPLGLLAIIGLTIRLPAAVEVDNIRLEPANGIKPISLRDRLVVGLEARIPSEIAFCELVALKVQTGKLPARIVNQTFFWARERAAVPRNGIEERPIVYFQPAMKLRAEKLHVTLNYVIETGGSPR